MNSGVTTEKAILNHILYIELAAASSDRMLQRRQMTQ
jgi:hypothetical protein